MLYYIHSKELATTLNNTQRRWSMEERTTPVADGKEWDAFFASRDEELKEMYGETMKPKVVDEDHYLKILGAVFGVGIWFAIKML